MNISTMKQSIILFLMVVCSIATAQELPDVTPVSPEAASIARYGQIPVGLFTGTAQVSVPIYTFTSGPLSIPVSLDYSSNGIRVDEYSSSAGLGWNLSAGGAITRSVYGKKDENQYRPAKDVDLNDPVARFFYASAAADPGPEGIDIQPDIFSFSFNGFSGKFYLDDNAPFITDRNVIFLEPSPVKVEILNVGIENHFRITDPSGIVYYFGGANAIEKSRYSSTNQAVSGDVRPLVPSAWYLTKITHPSGEEITFSYTSTSSTYKQSISQSVTRVDGFYRDSDACISSGSDSAFLNIAQGNTSYLSQISSTESGTITFNYSPKANMPTGFNKLEEIVIKNQHDTTIKSFSLEYDVVSSTKANLDFTQEPYFNTRFYLSKVTEISSSGTLLSPYTFEYNNPEGLPARFVYAQDHWGFYNGKDDNRNLIPTEAIDRIAANFVLYNALSGLEAADRSPSSTHANFGMIKEITYPTKGKNEFSYEGHGYYGEVTTNPPYVDQIANVTNTNPNGSFDTPVIPHTHKGWLSFGANLDDFSQGIGDTTNPLNFNIALIDVFDITTGTEVGVSIFDESDVHGNSPIPGVAYGITNQNFSKRKYVQLQKDHRYRFKIRLNNGYTLSNIKLTYFDQLPIVTTQKIPVGGMRIAEVKTLDGNGKVETKKYHYGNMDCLDCDSGVAIARNIEPHINTNTVLFNDADNKATLCGSTTISSNTAFPLYGVQGYHIGYNKVIEELGEDFKGGLKLHEFESDFLLVPNVAVFGEEYIAGLPYSNFFGFGRKLSEKTYKKENNGFKIVQEQTNEYTHKTSLDKETIVYSVRKARSITVGFADDPGYTLQNTQYHIGQYSLLRQWHTMSKRTTKQYNSNGENPLTTTEKFFYDNSDHLQQTRTEVTDSKGRIIKTQTIYPQDIAAANRTATEQKLIDQHQIAAAIDVITIEQVGGAEEVLSKVHNEYKDWGNNVLLPEEVLTAKGSNDLELRVKYTSYDNFGNPTEVAKADGTPMAYIWAYDHQYPVAKIENMTYSGVAAYVGEIQNKSNSDTDHKMGSQGTEGALRTELNKLHVELPADAMVTTYTYDPMVGVTSMTDPRGYTVYYEYDDFNRLQYVRDADGNLISENKYHYKN